MHATVYQFKSCVRTMKEEETTTPLVNAPTLNSKKKKTANYVRETEERQSNHLITPQFSTAPNPVTFSFFLKAFQNLNVSSPAPVTMTWPSGLIAR